MQIRFLYVVIAVLLFFLPQLAFSSECEPVAELVSLEGTTEYKPASADSWQPAALEQSFCTGDALRTGRDSRAAVRMINETLFRLDHNSTITFTHVVQKERSILDLLKGAVHFISRVPRSLEIKTPFVNAAIEGTEFVVTVKENSTEVTVYEGTVVARNDSGSIDLTANQTGKADAGQSPVRIVVAHPRDAVAWALYYPPLPAQQDQAGKLAHQTIGAIVKNDIERAATFAEQAIAANPQSAAAFMAQSYVDQAKFDIPSALTHSRKAAELAPQDAITQARLAEVLLMTGDTKTAKATATDAVQLDPSLAHTQTVLGFSSLRAVNLGDAESAFKQAIQLDSAAPLPRLGLGLVKIRRGDLKAGRADIETAALLDPNNALLRSYMGKAYYEEKRSELASEQFAMAKDLDPNDPTAWFYDSILLQSENRPVKALQAQQKAIALNDNRGVYRSRQLLDKDNAARDVALGRIYNDLSFEQLASLQATNALAQDPGNHSAHRLLADSYAGITNLDAARQSELLQSKLTQPLNLDPLQPQLGNANLGLLDGNGPGDLSYNEYNPLFTRNGMALQLDAATAENNTWSEDVIIAGLFNKFAFSLGQYHTESDGFRPNADYEQDIVNAFAQFAFSEDTSFQIEVSKDEEEKGDVTQRLLPELTNIPTLRINNEISTLRVGLNHALTRNTNLQLSVIRREQDISNIDSLPGLRIIFDTDKDIDLYDAQLGGKLNNYFWLAGLSYNKEDAKTLVELDFSPAPCPPFLASCITPVTEKESQARLYGYFYYHPNNSLSVTSGLTLLTEDDDSDTKTEKAYPKLGLRWQPKEGNELRLAAFRNRTAVINSSQYETLEPTQIAGFNQIYDNLDLTDSWNYGAAYNHTLSKNLFAGANYFYRDLTSLLFLTDLSVFPPSQSEQELKYNDTTTGLWLNWTLNNAWSLGIDYSYNNYDLEKSISAANTNILSSDGVLELKTHKLPLSVSYFHPSGFSTELTTTYYDQEGKFIDTTGMTTQDGKDRGWVTDLALNYRFPKRLGSVSVGVKNLFDTDLLFEDRNSYDSANAALTASPSEFSEERLFFGKISINFR